MGYKFSAFAEVLELDENGHPKRVRYEDYELKDCPFCGKEPRPVQYNVEQGIKYQIFCGHCWQGQTTLHDVKEAVELWNMRILND